LPSSGDAEYDVSVIVRNDAGNNSYYTADTLKTVVTVYQPTGDFITGGGDIINTNSAGSMKADVNSRTNFGFNVKFNKKGTSLQGNLNFIFRRKETDNIVHTYQIKSNAMQSLAVNASDPLRQTANFVSKCNITDVTNPLSPVSIGGNKLMYVNMIDNSSPGKLDSISIVLADNSGDPTILSNILYSSNWVGNMTTMKNLSGGNLVVHSGFNLGSSAVTLSVNPRTVDNVPTVISSMEVKAYPNPAQSQFNIKLESSNTTDPIKIIVYGMNGNVVESKQNLKAGQSLVIGGLYRPGIYILEMIQGTEHKQLKLVKIPD
jgi:hypothetical protein